MIKRFIGAIGISLVAISWGSAGIAQTNYYAGKTITIVAGTKAGDVYDLYARLFAQYMPKYIPGNPNIIVQNMPGAGSMIAANYVYNVANPDGLTIGAIFPALYFDQIIGRSRSKVRLEQIYLARKPSDFESPPLHARGHALQVDRRRGEDFDATQMRRLRNQFHSVLRAEAPR